MILNSEFLEKLQVTDLILDSTDVLPTEDYAGLLSLFARSTSAAV